MAHREFRDRHGLKWNVWEVIPTLGERRRTPGTWPPDVQHERRVRNELRATLTADMAYGWLVFQTVGEKRRLVSFPADWSERGDAELATLCEAAEPTMPPRRLIE